MVDTRKSPSGRLLDLQVIAPAGHLVFIDSWSASNSPGFTTFTGPTPTVL